jgi:flavodoxin I
MGKALIIYGTTTGNTQEMSGMILEVLKRSGIESEMKNVEEASIADLTAGHDLVLLGCPAYGDEEIELQEDFSEFYESMDEVKLNGAKYAVFAPGDSSYEHFCGSVDMLEEKIEELGGKIMIDGLKVDGDPSDSYKDILEWVETITQELK